jgi:hypothetical protein
VASEGQSEAIAGLDVAINALLRAIKIAETGGQAKRGGRRLLSEEERAELLAALMTVSDCLTPVHEYIYKPPPQLGRFQQPGP